jgi:methyl-accepting chemotaxis protein
MEIGEFETYFNNVGENFQISDIIWDIKERYADVKQGLQNMSNTMAGLMNRLEIVI